MFGEGSSNGRVVVSVVVALIIGGLVGIAMPANPTSQTVSITFPGGAKLEMDVSQPEIEYSDLLESLFSKQFTRDGVLGWLRNNRIFEISDERLAASLEQDLCDAIPESPLKEKVSKAQECADKPIVRRLRELEQRKRVPFHYVGIPVKVGVQADAPARPPTGKANVCYESDLRGKRIELTDPVSGNEIVVTASQWYRCTGFASYPDIQLNPDEAKQLFNVPLLLYQAAVAVPLD